MCDPRDIGVVAEQQAAAGGLPTITVYEKIPAGIGFSQRLYELRDDLLRAVGESGAPLPVRARLSRLRRPGQRGGG